MGGRAGVWKYLYFDVYVNIKWQGSHDDLFQVFCAISGSDGTLLWSFDAKNALMNIYTSQFIRDLNGKYL